MSVTKTAAALLVVGLVVGVGIGYGIGFMYLETKTSAIKEACIQLEKDRDSLDLLRMFQMYGWTPVRVPSTDELEKGLAALSMIREKSGEVDPTLPSKVDAIMDNLKAVFDWHIVRAPPEDATWEEVALWEREGVDLLDQYIYDYALFEEAYMWAIMSHIRAATEL